MRLAIIVLSLFATVSANYCEFDYTPEQERLVFTAYAIGSEHDLGYTLASIVAKESFVGRWVVRVNPKDTMRGHPNPVGGSYSVMMLLLETAMELEGIDNQWEAKAVLVPRLMTDDLYAMRLALRHLVELGGSTWASKIRRYNSNPDYLEDIIDRVNKYQDCNYFHTSGS